MKFCAMILALSFLSLSAFADETVKDKAKEAANDTRRGAKQAMRATKDAACPIVNGKVECAVQKTKHTIQKGADNVEDAID